jgi:hypothetical protein
MSPKAQEIYNYITEDAARDSYWKAAAWGAMVAENYLPAPASVKEALGSRGQYYREDTRALVRHLIENLGTKVRRVTAADWAEVADRLFQGKH